ncbi:hypothetical protein B0H10DRAFT_758354 [Mycena sp. CBHHK59/15]|nr:hypothetical protein B0H10DRAFT_758354 [Mycena sp. CBHHK59/15]
MAVIHGRAHCEALLGWRSNIQVICLLSRTQMARDGSRAVGRCVGTIGRNHHSLSISTVRPTVCFHCFPAHVTLWLRRRECAVHSQPHLPARMRAAVGLRVGAGVIFSRVKVGAGGVRAGSQVGHGDVGCLEEEETGRRTRTRPRARWTVSRRGVIGECGGGGGWGEGGEPVLGWHRKRRVQGRECAVHSSTGSAGTLPCYPHRALAGPVRMERSAVEEGRTGGSGAVRFGYTLLVLWPPVLRFGPLLHPAGLQPG